MIFLSYRLTPLVSFLFLLCIFRRILSSHTLAQILSDKKRTAATVATAPSCSLICYLYTVNLFAYVDQLLAAENAPSIA